MTVGVFGERASISKMRLRCFRECGERMQHCRGFVNLSSTNNQTETSAIPPNTQTEVLRHVLPLQDLPIYPMATTKASRPNLGADAEIVLAIALDLGRIKQIRKSLSKLPQAGGYFMQDLPCTQILTSNLCDYFWPASKTSCGLLWCMCHSARMLGTSCKILP